MLALLALLALSSPAEAGPFGQKTMHGDWPARQVQSDFVLPKGWMQLQLEVDTKSTATWRDAEGQVWRWRNDAHWRYSRLWIKFDQGFTKRSSLYVHVPIVQAHLSNGSGTDTSTTALGDVHTGLWIQPVIDERSAFAFRIDLKAPSGVEWPSDFVGGPGNVQGFLTGTGVTNLGGFVHGRHRMGDAVAVDLSAGYVHKFPAIVGYVVEQGGFGNGWLDPGNELRASLGVTGQLMDGLALTADARLSARGTYRVGISGDSVLRNDYRSIADSSGLFVDVGGSVSWQPTDHFELGMAAHGSVMGSDTRLFAHLGLEEFSPQPGLTLGLRGAVRW